MTASEFGFLALGMLIGLATGAALVELLRARPGAREVRVTVQKDSVPRRSTLSEPAGSGSHDPAPGGPADRQALGSTRTPVQAPRPVGPGRPGSPTPVGPGPATSSPGAPGPTAPAPVAPPSPVTAGSAPARPGETTPPAPSDPNAPAEGPAEATDDSKGTASFRLTELPAPVIAPDGTLIGRAPLGSGQTGLAARLAQTNSKVGPTPDTDRRVGIPVETEPDPLMEALAAARLRSHALVGGAAQDGTGQPTAAVGSLAEDAADSTADDQARASARGSSGSRGSAGRGSAGRGSTSGQKGEGGSTGGAGTTTVTARGGEGASGGSTTASGLSDAQADSTDPCAEHRRAIDERCAIAERSRAVAAAAADTLRDAQRSYDDHHDGADRATEIADPRSIRTAKEDAQRRFRTERDAATDRAALEAAARSWLTEINRINGEAREAGTTAIREREAANLLATTLEQLSVQADAARITAETADEACLAARQALADCEETVGSERQAAARYPLAPSMASQSEIASGAFDRLGLGTSDEEPVLVMAGEGDAVILRLLRGDRIELGRIAANLGGDDAAERRRWQIAIAGLLEAIIARAIEASALDFPHDHPFWEPFTRPQSRDIMAALASLGYRFDGIGGFVDERSPSQRDLALAVGYAGLDPMRIRHWPTDQETAGLFDGVSVAADEYLVEAAGGMSLGELVSLLGRRADGLTDVWNAWGRIRPLLLDTA